MIGPDGAAVALAEVRVGPPPAGPRHGAPATRFRRPAAQPARPAQRDTGRARHRGGGHGAARAAAVAVAVRAPRGATLLPDTIYTVRVRDVRNVNGLVGGGEVPLRTPRRRAAAPGDARGLGGRRGRRRRCGQRRGGQRGRPARAAAQPPAPAPAPPPARVASGAVALPARAAARRLRGKREGEALRDVKLCRSAI